MYKLSNIVGLFLFLGCFVYVPCICMAGISETDKQRIETVLRGLDDSRMSLNSGVCRIVGSSDRGTLEIFDDNIFIAFDYAKGFYRFDQGEDRRSLRTPDYYYEYLADRQMVTRQSATERTPSFGIRPFDIRALGFFNFIGPYWKAEYAVDERVELFNDLPISIEELNGVFVVTVERTPNFPGFSFPPVVRRYWIDSRQGFSLIRFELGEGLDTIEMSWKEINQVWVPTSFKLSSTQTMQSAEWRMDWSLVNEDIPEHYFDPTLLAGRTEMLVSLELDQPLIIGRIGEGLPLPEPLPLHLFQRENVSWFSARYILMWLGILMIVLGLGKMAYDYWRKRTS